MNRTKIRRCREHVARLKIGEVCPFQEHDKNNKIEEMSEQEAEILEWVEMNTRVERWKDNKFEREELWIRSERYYETNEFYAKDVIFDPQTQNLNEVIGDAFREIVELIIEDINKNVRRKDRWVFKKTVYQFCPDAVCGENPCICEEN